MNFCELEPAEFADFEGKNQYGNFFQSVERGKLREKMGFSSFLLGVKDGDKVLAAGLAVARNGEVWVQLGPVMDWENLKLVECFIDGMIDFCKKHKFAELEIYPPVIKTVRDAAGEKQKEFDLAKLFALFAEKGFKYGGETIAAQPKANRWMAVKDMSGLHTVDEAYASVHSTKRRYLKKTNADLEIKFVEDKKGLKDWRRALEDSNRKNGMPTRKLEYFEDIGDIFGEKAKFVEARTRDGGELTASALCMETNGELVLFLLGTVDEFKRLNGATAINGWMMEECINKKLKRLNFYGVDGDFSEKNHLLSFKAGFGIFVEEYVGEFSKVLNPGKYFGSKVKRKIGGVARKVLHV